MILFFFPGNSKESVSLYFAVRKEETTLFYKQQQGFPRYPRRAPNPGRQVAPAPSRWAGITRRCQGISRAADYEVEGNTPIRTRYSRKYSWLKVNRSRKRVNVKEALETSGRNNLQKPGAVSWSAYSEEAVYL